MVSSSLKKKKIHLYVYHFNPTGIFYYMMWDKNVNFFPKSKTIISVFLEQFFLFLLICDVTFTKSYVSWDVFLAIIPITFKNVCVCVPCGYPLCCSWLVLYIVYILVGFSSFTFFCSSGILLLYHCKFQYISPSCGQSVRNVV